MSRPVGLLARGGAVVGVAAHAAFLHWTLGNEGAPGTDAHKPAGLLYLGEDAIHYLHTPVHAACFLARIRREEDDIQNMGVFIADRPHVHLAEIDMWALNRAAAAEASVSPIDHASNGRSVGNFHVGNLHRGRFVGNIDDHRLRNEASAVRSPTIVRFSDHVPLGVREQRVNARNAVDAVIVAVASLTILRTVVDQFAATTPE